MVSSTNSYIIINKLNHVVSWLYFKKPPFNPVPRGEVDFWFGRNKIRKTVEHLTNLFPKNSTNQIIAIWGHWGTGKSHAIGYMKNRFGKKVQFIADAFPKQATNFAALYKQHFITNYDIQNFGLACKKIYKEIEDDPNGDRFNEIGKELWDNSYSFSDVVFNTGHIFSIKRNFIELRNDEDYRLIRQWLRGETLLKPDLKKIGAEKNLRQEADFINTMSYLIRISNSKYGGKKPVVWALDDSHTMQKPVMSDKHRQQIQQGIRAVFDKTATGLMIIIAMKADEPGRVKDLLIGDLQTRLSPEFIRLEQFDGEELDEAMLFVEEYLNHPDYKDRKQSTAKYFPFDKKSTIETALDGIQNTEDAFTARKIMIHLRAITNKAGQRSIIDEGFVSKYFDNLAEEQLEDREEVDEE